MLKKSNIITTSNVYVTSSDPGEDTEFRARVRGRENLRKMVIHLAGLKWIKDPGLKDHYRKYLTPLQIQEWELGMYCALQEDKEDLVWGIVKKSEKESFGCRCYHYKCKYFNKCRPGFEPGESPSVIVRGRDWKRSAVIVKEPALESDDTIILEPVGIKPDYNSQFGPQDNDFIVIDLENELDIPVYMEPVKAEPEIVTTVTPVLQGQEVIINADPAEHLMVLAGPGTGKTYCLIEKLKYLVEESGSIEADSILILCFTRAAVREIRDRFLAEIETDDFSDDFSRVEIRTFDSFATRVLLVRDVDVTARDYDERIQMVIDEIRSDPDILADMQHFIVDEIQDLVGVRARLVQTILEYLPEGCGFTLLGDQLQGIYDYQIKDQNGELSARGLINWVRQYFSVSLKEVGLTENRRQSGNLSDFSIQARRLIESEISKHIEKFFNYIEEIKTCGPEHKFNIPLEENQKLAVLCRNNGEVLKISNYLRRWGIEHTVRRGTRNQPLLPVWVAELLSGDNRAISRDLLVKMNNKGEYWYPEDTDRIFYGLENLTSTKKGILNCDEIRHALASGERLPDEIYEESKKKIYVSTIHQSKGREYDSVLFLRPDRVQEEDLFEEAKIYYVALTRAKNKLFTIDRRRSGSYLAANVSNSGRWTELAWKKGGKKKLVSVEVGLEDDVDVQSFVDGNLLCDPVENQKFIREELKVGQLLELRRIDEDKGYYGIFLERKMLGRMSGNFMRDIKNVMGGVYVKFNNIPKCFDEVYVDRIYTVIKKPETIRNSVAEPWASSGVWYAIGVTGMGLVRWDFDC